MGILITGAAGLIGSTLVKKLENQGHEVISCDIRFRNNPLSFFSEDIVPLLAKCTGIIHLAAISRVIHGELYPQLCQKINVDGTMQFLGLCKSLSNKPWFIYASSREVYGEQKKLPVTESASIDPINNYAKGKAFIEEQITSLKDFNVAILRFSNVYGGLLDHNSRVIPALCINALRGDPIKIEGKECVFDFTYLDDVIEGICLTVKYLQSEKSSLPAIHLTTNSPCTLENLAKTILKVTESDSRIDFYPPRNFDVTKFHGDFTRAKELLGWSPKHSLKVGLGKFIKSLQNNTQEYPNNIDMVIYENIKSYSKIVVPSIWGENSPLVIHEAQQLRIPVITADYGGMAENVRDGLLFKHRDASSLSEKMQVLSTDRKLYSKLTQKGYPYTENGNIPSISEHTEKLNKIYRNAIEKKGKSVAVKPGPWRITFDTNPDYCNFACIMCECFSPHSKVKEEKKAKGIKPKILSIETIRKVIKEAAGTPLREIIPSTMGEPLMYKSFDEIINLCHEFSLKLNLTTNGSFPIKGARKWAELLVPILSDVKISWNGATKETHERIMKGSKWEVVTENLKTFLEVRDKYFSDTGERCTVTLQLTFLESNLHELYDIVKMAIKNGIDRVKGHHLWAHFEEIKDLSMRRDELAISRWNTEVRRLYELRDNMLLPNGKKIKLENFTILSQEGIKDLAPGGQCPFLGKEAWINNEGKFSPCCAPDELRKTLGNFGNVNEVKLEEIWQSSEYLSLQKNYLNYKLCKTCNMRKPLIN